MILHQFILGRIIKAPYFLLKLLLGGVPLYFAKDCAYYSVKYEGLADLIDLWIHENIEEECDLILFDAQRCIRDIQRFKRRT